MSKDSYFTFHGSLNDFLSPNLQGGKIHYVFFGNPTIKDAMEAQGVPHPEIGKIYINGSQEDFNYKLQSDDNVEVFPIQITISDNKPLQFMVDSHLGKLAKDLRVLGFDCLYDVDYTAEKIISIAVQESKIVLTRNIGLLKSKQVSQGYWLRSQEPETQVKEVIKHFNLYDNIKPFTRCRVCNGLIDQVSKQSVEENLPQMTKVHFQDFYQCRECRRVYWKGSHYEKMLDNIEKFKNFK